ncbi:MAG TPA: HAD family hydrolase [Alphaproteobacteria bacterium]|nr:HAD family hydrolase [Alphaproteobacteria bacterium]
MDHGPKHIVFDWNCTLLDDVQALFDCTNGLLQKEGHAPLTIEHFRDNYEIPFTVFYGRMGFNEDQVARLMSLENSAFHDNYEPRAAKASLREGASEILDHAKALGVNSMILSNHIVDPIKVQLKRLKVDHLFSEVLAYADRATQFKHMTKGERLKRFMKERGYDAHDAIIVGDTIEEIEIARDQGFVSVAITGGCTSEKRLRDQNPHYVIHSLHELKNVMQERGFA